MRFDHTKGQKAKYLVSLHWETGYDLFYYHYYKDAKAKFDRLKAAEPREARSISLYDMVKDVRKEFARI